MPNDVGGKKQGMMKCQFRVVTDEAALAALKPEWDALYRQSADRYYSESFDWCWCGWTAVAKPRGRKLHCLVATADDRVVLIWPLVIHRKYLWSIARPLGSETTEYSNVLVEEGPEADSRMELAWQVLRRTSRYDVLRLPFVRDGSRLHRLVAARGAFSFAEPFIASAVDWRGSPDWTAYHRSLDGKQRRDIGRRWRRLAETGEVTFAAVEVDQRPAVIDWTIEQKRRWLVRRERQNDWLGTEEYRNFLMAIAERTKGEQSMIVSALRLDGAVIAASLARADGPRIEMFLAAFDPSYQRFSASHIAYANFLEWCFKQGLEVDLRIGKERFKDHWHLRKSKVTTYEIAASPWGAAFILLKMARRRWAGLRLKRPRKSPQSDRVAHGES
jgi:CelD/BcsL family acetyltransferase involved in cellulose biosynthesis